jgi:aspartyl-tRNA(Asn)/glutamyl-tRNA(Gln) amidotransferase subunit C
MSSFTSEQLHTLEKLCRLKLTPEEERKFCDNLKRMLDYMAMLNEIDTEGVKPCSHVLESMTAPLREDIAERLIPRKEFLDNAPEHVGGMIKVPKVIKDEL